MTGKMILNLFLTGVVLGGLVLMSCAAPPAPAPQVNPPPQGAVQGAGWEQDWQKTLTAARAEGPLNIYSPASAEVRVAMTRAFKEKYGLDIEWTAGKAAEVAEKILRERQARLYVADLIMGSTLRQLTTFKPGGMLDPIKPRLVLPEVLDKNLWFGGDIPWADKEKMYTMGSVRTPNYRAAINTNLVRPGELTSYNDLLDPRWKGKIIVLNPVLTPKLFAEVAKVMGIDWWTKLVANSPMVLDDDRLGNEWLAQGKYPIGILSRQDIRQEFIKAGAPIQRVMFKEASFLDAGAIDSSLLKNAPNPNAAKIFVNWYLSKEGADLQARVIGVQSARLDVSADHLPPELRRDPSAKYIETATEEFNEYMLEVRDRAGEIFAPLLRK